MAGLVASYYGDLFYGPNVGEDYWGLVFQRDEQRVPSEYPLLPLARGVSPTAVIVRIEELLKEPHLQLRMIALSLTEHLNNPAITKGLTEVIAKNLLDEDLTLREQAWKVLENHKRQESFWN